MKDAIFTRHKNVTRVGRIVYEFDGNAYLCLMRQTGETRENASNFDASSFIAIFKMILLYLS